MLLKEKYIIELIKIMSNVYIYYFTLNKILSIISCSIDKETVIVYVNISIQTRNNIRKL